MQFNVKVDALILRDTMEVLKNLPLPISVTLGKSYCCT